MAVAPAVDVPAEGALAAGVLHGASLVSLELLVGAAKGARPVATAPARHLLEAFPLHAAAEAIDLTSALSLALAEGLFIDHVPPKDAVLL